MNILENKNIISEQEMTEPKTIKNELPLSDTAQDHIAKNRDTISNIVHGKDDRIIAITGPCSIHDTKSALEIAKKIKTCQKILPHLFLIMRVYFEKPRTTIGWKGLINDPKLDGTHDIEQ